MATTGPTTSSSAARRDARHHLGHGRQGARCADARARGGGSHVGRGWTPARCLRLSARLDIDADALTAAVTEPPPGDRASSAMAGNNGAASAADSAFYSGADAGH